MLDCNGTVSGTLDSRLSEIRAQILCCCVRLWASLFTLHCSSSLTCTNEYLAIDSGGHLHTTDLHILKVAWLDAIPREVEMVFD